MGLAANEAGRTGGVFGSENEAAGGVGGTLGVVNALGGGRFAGTGSSDSMAEPGIGSDAEPEPERERVSDSSSVIETVIEAVRGGMTGRMGCSLSLIAETGLDAERCGIAKAAGG